MEIYKRNGLGPRYSISSGSFERSNFSRVIKQQRTQELGLSRDNVAVWVSRIPHSKHIPRSGTGK